MDEIDEIQGEKIRILQNMYSLFMQPYLAARSDAIQKITQFWFKTARFDSLFNDNYHFHVLKF
jgi:hypothetical protein